MPGNYPRTENDRYSIERKAENAVNEREINQMADIINREGSFNLHGINSNQIVQNLNIVGGGRFVSVGGKIMKESRALGRPSPLDRFGSVTSYMDDIGETNLNYDLFGMPKRSFKKGLIDPKDLKFEDLDLMNVSFGYDTKIKKAIMRNDNEFHNSALLIRKDPSNPMPDSKQFFKLYKDEYRSEEDMKKDYLIYTSNLARMKEAEYYSKININISKYLYTSKAAMRGANIFSEPDVVNVFKNTRNLMGNDNLKNVFLVNPTVIKRTDSKDIKDMKKRMIGSQAPNTSTMPHGEELYKKNIGRFVKKTLMSYSGEEKAIYINVNAVNSKHFLNGVYSHECIHNAIDVDHGKELKNIENKSRARYNKKDYDSIYRHNSVISTMQMFNEVLTNKNNLKFLEENSINKSNFEKLMLKTNGLSSLNSSEIKNYVETKINSEYSGNPNKTLISMAWCASNLRNIDEKAFNNFMDSASRINDKEWEYNKLKKLINLTEKADISSFMNVTKQGIKLFDKDLDV